MITTKATVNAVFALVLLSCLFSTSGPVRAATLAADSCNAPLQTVAARSIGFGTNASLQDIAATPDGLWAVGSASLLDTRYQQPLIQRWDGSRWITADTPIFTTPGTFLEGSAVLAGVAVLTPNTVWAVGTIGSLFGSSGEALILRWDGQSWSRLPNTGALSSFTGLNDIVALAPNDVWVIGPRRSSSGIEGGIARWDGATWSLATLPPQEAGTVWSAIAAGAGGELWVVGYRLQGLSTPLALRYSAGTWTRVPLPVADGQLFAVAGRPGGSFWAVGTRGIGPLTLRWDGAQFVQVPAPGSGELYAVAVAADDDVWAAGYSGAGGVFIHWDGAAWEAVARASDGFDAKGYNELLLASSGDLWAVGYEGDQSKTTLVSRLQPRVSIGRPRLAQVGDEQAVVLTLELNAPAAAPVRVTIRTEDAGAVAGRDYTAVNTTVTIPKCERSASVQVPLTTAANPPSDSAFRLVIDRSSGAAAEPASRLVPLGGSRGVAALPLIGNNLLEPRGRLAYTAPVEADNAANTEIFTAGIDGSGVLRLTNAPGQDGAPSWSPDGRRIVFTSNRDGNANVYVMNADGSGQTRLTNEPGFDGGAMFSPDGSRIAFISDRQGQPQLYLMDTSGGAVTPVASEIIPVAVGSFAWSPDGKALALESRTEQAPGIFTVTLEGNVRRLTSQSGDVTPAWSPDGRLIAFFRSSDELKGLYLIQPDGSGLREVNANFDTNGAPAWSPDGNFIAYGYTFDGRVAITGLDGRQPLDVPLPNRNSAGPAWAPRP